MRRKFWLRIFELSGWLAILGLITIGVGVFTANFSILSIGVLAVLLGVIVAIIAGKKGKVTKIKETKKYL